MKVLGIESSCDETAAAIVEDGHTLLSNIVASSAAVQAQYGGVVPEIAARSHIEAVNGVVRQALDDAHCSWDDVDAIAVTYGPGLGGSLLIGVLTARTLAIIHEKPLYAIDHVEAHVYANFLIKARSPRGHSVDDKNTDGQENVDQSDASIALTENNHLMFDNSGSGFEYVLPAQRPQFPLLALIVSGGHSQLVLFQNHFDYQLLGQTHDDAIGEAFDKVAKILGLPYPGGPRVAMTARTGNARAFDFPKAKMDSKYDFSFSGLKTAVLRTAQQLIGEDHTFPSKNLPERLSDAQKADIAASFQHTAIETVVDKTVIAYTQFQPASVVIAGGVASSAELRRQLAERLPCPITYTDPRLCTDNGAMIATLGCFHMNHDRPIADPYTLEIRPNLSM